MLRLLWDVQTLSAAHRRVAAAPLILQDALPFVPNPGRSPGVVLEVCALTHTVRDRHPFSYQDDVHEALPRHRARMSDEPTGRDLLPGALPRVQVRSGRTCS